MSAEIIAIRANSDASDARIGITPNKTHHYFDDLFSSYGGELYGNNVETRVTRVTHDTAQHWLDALLDDKPVIESVPAPTAPPLPKTWLVRVPGREPFGIVCVQGCSSGELLARYPSGTTAEAIA